MQTGPCYQQCLPDRTTGNETRKVLPGLILRSICYATLPSTGAQAPGAMRQGIMASGRLQSLLVVGLVHRHDPVLVEHLHRPAAGALRKTLLQRIVA